MKTENAGAEILTCGGMWSVESQWHLLSHKLKHFGITLHSRDYPGHGRRYNEGIDGLSIEDYVKDKIAELRSLGRPMFVIGHSLGATIAARVAEEVPELVLGVITLAHASFFPQAMLPWNSAKQVFHADYLKAMFTGKGFGLDPDTRAFVADGCEVDLGLESGIVLRQILTGVGFRVPRHSNLVCPSAVIAATDDRVIPSKTAAKVAAYHRVTPQWVEGGHFAHCDMRYVEHIVSIVATRVTSWQQQPALQGAA